MTDTSIMDRILPDCYLYISHLDEDYQYWLLPGYPDDITDSMSTQFQPNTALGRTAPIQTYSSSGPRTISITIRFHRDMFEEMQQTLYYQSRKDLFDSDGTGSVDDWVEKFIKALQSISVPKYTLTSKAIEPPLVAVRFGQEVFIKGIVTGNVSVTYKKPILSNEKYALVEVSFSITEVDPYDATTVFQNGSFRGMTATLRQGMNF